MIAGHITTTYALGDMLRRCKITINISLLIFGALLPDLIDKGLAHFFIYPSRGLAHSLFIQILIACFFFRVIKKSKQILLIVFAGTLLHLLQDWPDRVVLLWPFLGAWEPGSPYTFLEKIYNFYLIKLFTLDWCMEIAGAVYVIFKLFFFKTTKSNIQPGAVFFRNSKELQPES